MLALHACLARPGWARRSADQAVRGQERENETELSACMLPSCALMARALPPSPALVAICGNSCRAWALRLLVFAALALSASASAEGTCESPAEGGGATGCAAEMDKGAGLILYGNQFSTCTRRVLLALFEKGLTGFKLQSVDLTKREQKSPEHLKLQPFGQVPALKDGNLTLFESRAIARYIAEKYDAQGTPLLGSTPEERALVNVWFEVESQEYNPHVMVINYEMIIGKRSGKEPDVERAKAAAEKLASTLDVYEARLQESEYLAGRAVSLADLSHVSTTANLWAAGYSHLIEERPHVKRWWEQLSARESWKTILKGL